MTKGQGVLTVIIFSVVLISEMAVAFRMKKHPKGTGSPPPLRMKSGDWRKTPLPRKATWMFVVGLFGALFWGVGLAWLQPRDYCPLTANPGELKSITILPEGQFALTDKPVELSKDEIREVCNVLRQAYVHPGINHPSTDWGCVLRFQTTNESSSIRILNSGDERNGVIIWGWGDFRCDPLAITLESIVGSRKDQNTNSPSRAIPLGSLK